MEKIIIHNVNKLYDGKTVLDIEHLEILKGEIVAILGKNGSGKSTLIKIISGLLYQDKGRVNVFGLDNKNRKVRNITKFVQESGKGYYDYLTSKENIDYFLGLNKISKKDIKDKLELFIDRFAFKEHLDKKVSELSQGNRQKLSIIVSLLTNPKILLLDEPTNGLDLVTSDFLLRNLKKISDEEDKTILLTTHDLGFIDSLDVRCIILEEGHIVFDDKISSLIGKNDTYVYEILVNRSQSTKIDDLDIDNRVRFSYKDEDIIVKVYEEETRNLILSKVEVEEYRKADLTIEDIYYQVIHND